MHSSQLSIICKKYQKSVIFQKNGSVNEMANITYIVSTYSKIFPVKKVRDFCFHLSNTLTFRRDKSGNGVLTVKSLSKQSSSQMSIADCGKGPLSFRLSFSRPQSSQQPLFFSKLPHVSLPHFRKQCVAFIRLLCM